MNCIYCGTPLSGIDYCTGCGADITIQKRIIRISNLLYNEGLDKAKVRDLSGAAKSLRRSLEFNKENMDARNLLGLVYFESGEVVQALTEWVISKNMNVSGNVAEMYIDRLQSSKNKLDTINQTIRKYNQALTYCREDHDDMAVIQLKKVLSQNPKLIKAYHLLSLIYLKHQDYEKARKLLKKAAFIDTNNTTTLRYLQEVELATGISTSLDVKRKKKYAKEKVDKVNGTVTYMNGNEMIIQPTTFRDSSAIATFLNIFLGIALGVAVVWFLVIPATRQGIYDEANQQVTDANTQVAAQATRVRNLEEEVENYKSRMDEAEQIRDEANRKTDSYEQLLKAANNYLAGDVTKAADTLNGISEDGLNGEAKQLYASLHQALADYVFQEAYREGTNAYSIGDYAKAISELKKAVEAKPEDYYALHYLAFAYRNSNDIANANATFGEIVQRFPTQAAANNISSYIVDEYAGSDQGSGTAQGTQNGQDAQGGQTYTENDTGDNGNTGDTGDAGNTGNTGNTGEADNNGSLDINSMFGIR